MHEESILSKTEEPVVEIIIVPDPMCSSLENLIKEFGSREEINCRTTKGNNVQEHIDDLVRLIQDQPMDLLIMSAECFLEKFKSGDAWLMDSSNLIKRNKKEEENSKMVNFETLVMVNQDNKAQCELLRGYALVTGIWAGHRYLNGCINRILEDKKPDLRTETEKLLSELKTTCILARGEMLYQSEEFLCVIIELLQEIVQTGQEFDLQQFEDQIKKLIKRENNKPDTTVAC